MPTLTSITCNIKDSGGNALTGFIRVTLDNPIQDDTNDYTIVSSVTPLVAGSCTLSLPASDLKYTSYLFEVVNTAVTPNIVCQSFHATVPTSASPINFNSLVPTGITQNALASGIAAVSSQLYNSQAFWDSFNLNVFPPKGTYSDTTTYRRGNVVYWQGSSYAYIYGQPGSGVSPADPTRWQILASIGLTGSGTTGNNAVYDATGWLGQTDAPSRNAVRNKIETLATQAQLTGLLTGSVLTNCTIAADPPANDSSTKIADTAWVQALVAAATIGVNPIGTIQAFGGTSAPTKWLLCDGRAVSRTTYAALYAVLGTLWGAGDGSTTFNLPDLRGRVPTGADTMSAFQGAANRMTGTTALQAIGGNAGADTVTLSLAQMPSHSHAPGGGTSPSFATYVASGGTLGLTTGTNVLLNSATTSQGSGSAHNNVQPSLAVAYIIYAGI